MKFQVYMKCPDALDRAIHDAVQGQLMYVPDEDKSEAGDSLYEEALHVACKWFRYQEYLTVEIDTEAKTCTVLER
jgi:hypothetical protein